MKQNIHFLLTQKCLECHQDEPFVNLSVMTMSLSPSVSMDTEGLKVIDQVKEACSEQVSQSIEPWLSNSRQNKLMFSDYDQLFTGDNGLFLQRLDVFTALSVVIVLTVCMHVRAHQIIHLKVYAY